MCGGCRKDFVGFHSRMDAICEVQSYYCRCSTRNRRLLVKCLRVTLETVVLHRGALQFSTVGGKNLES